MDQSKYDGKKYTDVEDIVAAADPHKEINWMVKSQALRNQLLDMVSRYQAQNQLVYWQKK